MSDKAKQKGKGYFDLGDSRELSLGSKGNLVVKGDAGASVRYVSSGEIHHDAVTNQLISTGDLVVSVPYNVALTLDEVKGNSVVKGIKGNITALGEIHGNLSLRGSDGHVQLSTVHGDCSIKQVGGKVTIGGVVHGNVQLRHVGDVDISKVSGDINLKHVSAVSIGAVGGNAVVHHATGDVTLPNVAGDCAVAHVSGTLKVVCHDDIRARGPFSPGKHALTAASTIDLNYPVNSPLIVSAEASRVVSKIDFEEVTESSKSGPVNEFNGRIGHDGPTVIMRAPERIRIRPIHSNKGDFDFGGFADFEFDFGDIDVEMSELGDRISAEINLRMNELSSKIGPEIGVKAESALRKAQSAIDKAINKMESEMSKAQSRASQTPTWAPKPPPPPRSPQPPKSAEQQQSTTEAQLKILKMLEEGKINVEEANQLLAALG